MHNLKANANKGFSLVELIVVIAIMAVMVAVLAPSLLQYVEKSRAQKDDSAMGELTNAVNLALADQDVYDEVLYYSTKNNISCYHDTKADAAEYKIQTKDVEGDGETITGEDYWMHGDDARLADEVAYKGDGSMRGVTLTFLPDSFYDAKSAKNASQFTLAKGIVNGFIHEDTKNGLGAGKELIHVATGTDSYINGTPAAETWTFEKMSTDGVGTDTKPANHYLYNKVRATMGDTIELTSQTYRNSPYTVFIRMGSTGGNQASANDAMKVYGQWGGTNLDQATLASVSGDAA